MRDLEFHICDNLKYRYVNGHKCLGFSNCVVGHLNPGPNDVFSLFSFSLFCLFFDVALVANKVICISLLICRILFTAVRTGDACIGSIFFTNHKFHCTFNSQFTPPERLDNMVLTTTSKPTFLPWSLFDYLSI